MHNYTNHEVNLNGFSYSVDFYLTHEGATVILAIEPFEDGNHRDCTAGERLLIKLELDELFSDEIATIEDESEYDAMEARWEERHGK